MKNTKLTIGLLTLGSILTQSCQKDYYLEDLDAARLEIENLKNQLSTMNQENKAQVQELNNMIAHLESAVIGLEDALNDSQAINADQADHIEELTNEVIELEETIIDLLNQLTEQDLLIEDLETKLQNEEISNTQYNNLVSKLNNEIQTLKNQLALAQADLLAVAVEIEHEEAVVVAPAVAAAVAVVEEEAIVEVVIVADVVEETPAVEETPVAVPYTYNASDFIFNGAENMVIEAVGAGSPEGHMTFIITCTRADYGINLAANVGAVDGDGNSLDTHLSFDMNKTYFYVYNVSGATKNFTITFGDDIFTTD